MKSEKQPRNVQFVGEKITISPSNEQLYKKSPNCPLSFTWRGISFPIVRQISAWQDFARRGRMQKNMRPNHALRALRKGSWGVGRFFFQVETSDGKICVIYYDRSPENVFNRQGNWFLFSIAEIE